jgi:hypothetical protein
MNEGQADRVVFPISIPKKELREAFQFKVNSLKMRTGQSIYEVLNKAIECYEQKLNADRASKSSGRVKIWGE